MMIDDVMWVDVDMIVIYGGLSVCLACVCLWEHNTTTIRW
jgi:hypothetical protein